MGDFEKKKKKMENFGRKLKKMFKKIWEKNSRNFERKLIKFWKKWLVNFGKKSEKLEGET